MQDDSALTLRQIDQARGDLYAISDDLEFIKLQLSRLPTHAYFSLLLATASVWALIGVVVLLLLR